MDLKIQVSGFAAVGVVATIFQYGLMAIMIDGMGLGALSSSTLSYALSALLNYCLNRHFVFRSQVRHVDALPRFAAIVLLGLLLNAGLMYLLVKVLALHWLLAQAMATVGVMVSNFLLSKYWAFQEGKLPVGR